MHRLVLLFRRAVDALRRGPFVSAVAIGTIFVAVLLTGGFAAAFTGAEGLLSAWARDVPISVYLAADADLERARAEAVRLAPGARVVAVSPADALRRLRNSLGDQATVLDGVGPEVLPASVEVWSRGSLADTRALAGRLRAVPGAADVDYGAAWLERLEGVLRKGRAVGLALLGLLATATAVLVANTLRLAVYARRDEIEIMKLVGATDAHVGAPFLLEGLLQGLAGAGLAVAALLGATTALLPWLRSSVPLAVRLSRPDLLPNGLLLALLAGGSALGVASSALALGRFLRRV
ncbi:MAG TPA: permease-like cell division protein FtsX [Anaeromyxobacteraceae bacterium]|nr:permease-like cell division protein FtsX [Anaeromyxobacteraceae bacterium]